MLYNVVKKKKKGHNLPTPAADYDHHWKIMLYNVVKKKKKGT